MSNLVEKFVNLLLYGCASLWRHKEMIAIQKMVAISHDCWFIAS